MIRHGYYKHGQYTKNPRKSQLRVAYTSRIGLVRPGTPLGPVCHLLLRFHIPYGLTLFCDPAGVGKRMVIGSVGDG